MTYVISPPSRRALQSAAVVLSENPDDLMKAGNGAFRRHDFESAAKLFKRVLDKDPKYENAWDAPGRTYAALYNHDEAIKAFQKQIELDAYDQQANRDLGEQYEQVGRADDAVAAYRKQIEIMPLDPVAHKRLGLLLVSLKRDVDARPELEAASKISPDDSEVQLALAQLYARVGESDKAKAFAKGVTGGGTVSLVDDPFSAALRDDVDPDRSAQDARRALSGIGDHFDSGDYDQLNPYVFSAMRFVALAWARIGGPAICVRTT
jgi:predicted Zn-dependent protease